MLLKTTRLPAPPGSGGTSGCPSCSSKLWGSREMAEVQTGTVRREGPAFSPCPPSDSKSGSFPLQYFVFDFHVPPDVMFDKIIKISVSGEQSLVGGALSSNCTSVQT